LRQGALVGAAPAPSPSMPNAATMMYRSVSFNGEDPTVNIGSNREPAASCARKEKVLYRCSACGWSTVQMTRFWKHTQTAHVPTTGGEETARKLWCPHCSFSTSQQSFLADHMRISHNIFPPEVQAAAQNSKQRDFSKAPLVIRVAPAAKPVLAQAQSIASTDAVAPLVGLPSQTPSSREFDSQLREFVDAMTNEKDRRVLRCELVGSGCKNKLEGQETSESSGSDEHSIAVDIGFEREQSEFEAKRARFETQKQALDTQYKCIIDRASRKSELELKRILDPSLTDDSALELLDERVRREKEIAESSAEFVRARSRLNELRRELVSAANSVRVWASQTSSDK